MRFLESGQRVVLLCTDEPAVIVGRMQFGGLRGRIRDRDCWRRLRPNRPRTGAPDGGCDALLGGMIMTSKGVLVRRILRQKQKAGAATAALRW